MEALLIGGPFHFKTLNVEMSPEPQQQVFIPIPTKLTIDSFDPNAPKNPRLDFQAARYFYKQPLMMDRYPVGLLYEYDPNSK